VTALAHTLGRRTSARASLATDVGLIVIGSVVVAAAAQVSIRLPFTPVPITLQTLAVLVVGASLGAVRGAASLGLYLGEGAAGFPVFAEAKSGALYLTSADPLHTTGGYLWGFVAAALVVGALAQRRWDRSLRSSLGAMLVGEIVVFAAGVPWLAAALGVSGARALELGLYPFVVGEVLKLLLGAGLLPAAWRVMGAGASRSRPRIG
jgi:biotin transport system substrate-specific component